MTTLQHHPDVRPARTVASETDHRLTDSLIASIATVIGAVAVYLFFHAADATMYWFGTEYVIQDLNEGWRFGMAAISAGIFGTWFAWISSRWSKLGTQMESKVTRYASLAVVVLAIAMAFLAVWIF